VAHTTGRQCSKNWHSLRVVSDNGTSSKGNAPKSTCLSSGIADEGLCAHPSGKFSANCVSAVGVGTPLALRQELCVPVCNCAEQLGTSELDDLRFKGGLEFIFGLIRA
ncbi:MAG TPA: hypothetical protein DEF45_18820, partial [Rhodopirellula sp.]|nr:hypothetical protein [Rhodopirellula sp.]